MECQGFEYSKKSPTVVQPTERTPKPEYFIALATYFGVPLVRSHWIFDGNNAHVSFDAYQIR